MVCIDTIDKMVKGLEEAFSEGVEYADASQVTTKIIQVALRGVDLEVNRYFGVTSGFRVVLKGAWGIASRENSWSSELVQEAINAARISSYYVAKLRRTVSLTPISPLKGIFRRKIELPSVDEMIQFVKDITGEVCSRLSELDVVPEVILSVHELEKLYVNSDGTTIQETKTIMELLISVISRNVLASEYIALSLPLNDLSKHVENLIEGISRRLSGMTKAKVLNPLLRGSKFEVVLNPTLTGALIHEIVHYLEADRLILQRQKIASVGMKLGNEDLTVVDDPTIEWCVGSYVVDDEGVKARCKVLIENGIVVNLLHTRWSASVYGTEPTGNARGLFTIPKAMQSNIVVKAGDWKVSEMIEETRKGFYLEGLLRAELRPDGVIVLWPESAWYIERGEVRNPVKIDHIALNVSKALSSIEGIGREYGYRASVEYGKYVSEVVPCIKLRECYIY